MVLIMSGTGNNKHTNQIVRKRSIIIEGKEETTTTSSKSKKSKVVDDILPAIGKKESDSKDKKQFEHPKTDQGNNKNYTSNNNNRQLSPPKRNFNKNNGTTTDNEFNNKALLISQTRVCIKNIPQNYNESDIRNYIIEQLSKLVVNNNKVDSIPRITDCKVLRNQQTGVSRRIAFVGFAQASHAVFCQSKLNKAYCNNARLIVEFAHLPTNNNNNNKSSTTTEGSGTKEVEKPPIDDIKDDATTTEKTKNNKNNNNNNDPFDLKKQEFLAVMGVVPKDKKTTDASTAKRKFWANDDDDIVGTQNQIQQQDNDGDDDDDSSSSSSDSSDSDSSNEDSDDNNNNNDTAKDVKKEDQEKVESTGIGLSNLNDDFDFLRSKQIQIDDFDDDVPTIVDDNNNNNTNNNNRDNHNNNSNENNDISNENNERKEKEESDDSSSSSSSSDDSDDDDDSSISDEEDEADPLLKNKIATLANTPSAAETNNKVEISKRDNDDENDKHDDQQQQDEQDNTTPITRNRLFIRNLPFTTTDDELKELFEPFGEVDECHIPVDDQKRNKGYAFITFVEASAATKALTTLDGKDFQGRLLHILPARKIPDDTTAAGITTTTGEHDPTLSYKQKMEKQRQLLALKDTTGWSASYIRGDAVIDNLASRLGIKKGDILSVKDTLNSGDAAVRLALAETAIIEENRQYFAQHNIDMEALVSYSGTTENDKNNKKNIKNKNGENSDPSSNNIQRSKTSILVKNLPHDTTKEELLNMFASSSGNDDIKVLLPPSRTIAVVEYTHPNEAKVAFKRLAYRRFKRVPLYLEWAPLRATINPSSSSSENATPTNNSPEEPNTTDKGMKRVDDDVEETIELVNGATPSIYVKNLNFTTTEEKLVQFFSKHFSDVRAVRIPQKVAPIKRKHPGNNTTEQPETTFRSMGYGFVEFGSIQSVQDAMKKLQGSILDGHTLILKPSSNSHQVSSTTAVVGSSNKATEKLPTKLMVRNVPFQASRKELLQLFGSFGQLKRVRLPKKFDGSHRGFAFIEYVTAKEAEAAMQSLSRTHLYGRHLVLEWASPDEETENITNLRTKAERDVKSATAAAAVVTTTQFHGKKTKFE